MTSDTQRHRMTQWIVRWICAALVGLQAGCGAERSDAPAGTERVVSLAPSITKQLYLLGVTDKIAGVTTYCPQPSDAPGIQTVGSIVEPSVEAIIRLKPDLVLTSTLTNKRRIEKLEALHVPVAVFPAARTFSELCDQFVDLGKHTGVRARAEETVARVKAKVDALRGTLLEEDVPRVFIQVGARPLYAAGQGTFLSDLVSMAGGSNVVRQTDFCTYSREAVLAKNPDCILVVTMGLVGRDEKQKWKQYGGLNAASNDRIHVVNPDRVCSPTPESFVDALALVAGLLHPSAVQQAEERQGDDVGEPR